MTITAYTFWNLQAITDIFWMIPLMGFAQLSLFGGYAIYLPELFPTRLRCTGTSFCYNVGRLVAAFGPVALGFSPAGLTPDSRSRCATPGSPCAWCSCSASRRCPSHPKPRAFRCRNKFCLVLLRFLRPKWYTGILQQSLALSYRKDFATH